MEESEADRRTSIQDCNADIKIAAMLANEDNACNSVWGVVQP